jgi:hypothetical protein
MLALKKYISLVLATTVLSAGSIIFVGTRGEAQDNKVETQLESIIGDCNKFDQIAKKGQAILEGKPQLRNPSDFARLANQVDKLKVELDGLKFSDRKLSSFQIRYSGLMGSLVQDLRGIVKALESKNSAALQQITQNLRKIGPTGKAIDVELKKYCTGV